MLASSKMIHVKTLSMKYVILTDVSETSESILILVAANVIKMDRQVKDDFLETLRMNGDNHYEVLLAWAEHTIFTLFEFS